MGLALSHKVTWTKPAPLSQTDVNNVTDTAEPFRVVGAEIVDGSLYVLIVNESYLSGLKSMRRLTLSLVGGAPTTNEDLAEYNQHASGLAGGRFFGANHRIGEADTEDFYITFTGSGVGRPDDIVNLWLGNYRNYHNINYGNFVRAVKPRWYFLYYERTQAFGPELFSLRGVGPIDAYKHNNRTGNAEDYVLISPLPALSASAHTDILTGLTRAQIGGHDPNALAMTAIYTDATVSYIGGSVASRVPSKWIVQDPRDPDSVIVTNASFSIQSSESQDVPTGLKALAYGDLTIAGVTQKRLVAITDTEIYFYGGTPPTDLMPTFGNKTVGNISGRVNSPISAVTLPEASGGDGNLIYSLTPTLPAGFEFNATNREITGTPSGVVAQTQYAWKATDVDGDVATLNFNIKVVADLFPDFGTADIDDISATKGVRITSVTLPEATGGNGPLSYSLAPALPVGLSFHPTLRLLSGTPTGTFSQTQYVYTVTDADGDTDWIAFNITVSNLVPSFADGASIANQRWTKGTSVGTITLPQATGGDGTLKYSLTPALPAGVTFNASTRQLTGNPTAGFPFTGYTYKATDVNGDVVSLTFNLKVTDPDAPPDPTPAFADNASIDNIVATRGTGITAVTLPAATGGDAPLTYSLSPALPTGMSFNAGTRELSGTPTQLLGKTAFTYTVTDNNGDSDGLSFDLQVDVPVDLLPSFGQLVIADIVAIYGSAITVVTLPAATGGDTPLAYSLTPALPLGMSFNAGTRQLSGTPTTLFPQTQFTYLATDADGDVATLQFNLAVGAPAVTPGTPVVPVSPRPNPNSVLQLNVGQEFMEYFHVVLAHHSSRRVTETLYQNVRAIRESATLWAQSRGGLFTYDELVNEIVLIPEWTLPGVQQRHELILTTADEGVPSRALGTTYQVQRVETVGDDKRQIIYCAVV